MTWGSSPSRGTQRNSRIRGGGTWSAQTRRLNRHQQERYRQEMGRGTWSAQIRRLDRARRRQERSLRHRTRRSYVMPVTVGALILGAALMTSPRTHRTGVAMLVFAVVVLVVITRRRKA